MNTTAVAFEELVQNDTARFLRVARRFLACEEDAQDAVQDALLAAYRSIGKFESAALLSTWLHRIVINACLMKLRTRRRRPEEALDDHLYAIGHAESPEAEFYRSEIRALVRRALEELPESQRVVLSLRDLDELSTEEVAARLGVTANAVKIRLHRARHALRAVLDQSQPRAADLAAAA